MNQSRRWQVLLPFYFLSFLLGACTSTQAAALPHIDLSIRTPLPVAAPREIAHLRMGIAAIISPQGTVESYGDLARYLAEQLGRPVDLVQRRTYAELNDMVAAREVDLAFICTNAFVVGNEQSDMELLLAPEIDGESVYHSQLIVPIESNAQSMVDLRGKVFAFTDPMSFTGRIYPIYQLQQIGETPERFFAHTFFTYNHDRAILAVAEGVADGAAVDSLVLAYALQRNPELARKIRIIHTSEAFGIPPVVVPRQLAPRQKAQIREILLAMHENVAGRRVLRELGFDRFVVVENSTYDGVRRLVHATGIGQ
ncbi:MAG: phosphate/phosphite/phosphonate ABC transporter substrate-binding protein [Caldilineaceae bacterium]|nr:phosphate/phosphite/phosphonate ABC transporter substrate-binding protein [Caldilineaceae bacterium]